MTILLLLLTLWPQQPHDGHSPAADQPATLMTGLGRLHHPIATSSPDAQRFFDQGLTLVYAFNHEEAVRSFRRAAELDPAAAMPHWGIALALGPNINDYDVDAAREKAAYDEAQRARTLAARAPAQERAYIDALVERYSIEPNADLKAMAVRYKDAMRELTRRYPDDLDAATLYAESLMDLHPVDAVVGRWQADRRHRRNRRHARGRAAPRSDAHRREPLLHPRRRGVEDARPRAGERRPARDIGSRRRPSRPHAGAHLHAHRQLRGRRREQREGRRSGSRSTSRREGPTASTR